jgi:hypothetical protein
MPRMAFSAMLLSISSRALVMKRISLLEGIAERFGQFRLCRQLGDDLACPLEDRGEMRRGLGPLHQPLSRRGEARLVLDRVENGDAVDCLFGD